MKSHFFNPRITSFCRFHAARDMCHPVTVRLPKRQRSRSWHSTITIVSISILLVTDWMALKSHMPLCLFSFPMCVVQENPNSRTFILLYLRILILFSHTHTLFLNLLHFKFSKFSSSPTPSLWHLRSNPLLKPHLLLPLKARERRKLTSLEILPFPTLVVKWRKEWQSFPKEKLFHQGTCPKLALIP